MGNGSSGNSLGRHRCQGVHTEQLFMVKILFIHFECSHLMFIVAFLSADNKLWIYAGYDGNARLNDMWTVSLVVSAPSQYSKTPKRNFIEFFSGVDRVMSISGKRLNSTAIVRRLAAIFRLSSPETACTCSPAKVDSKSRIRCSNSISKQSCKFRACRCPD